MKPFGTAKPWLVLAMAATAASLVLGQPRPRDERRGQAPPRAAQTPRTQDQPPAPADAARPASDVPEGLVRNQRAYPTGDAATSVVLLERFTPAEVRSKQEFEYQIRLTNLTRLELTNLTLAEQLPEGFDAKGTAPRADRMEGAVMSWKLASLPAGQSKVIKVRGSGSQSSQLNFCATLTFDTVICSPMKIVEPKLQLDKTLPAEAIVCDPIPLKLVVTNTGSGALRGVRILDTLPEGWTTEDGKTGLSIDAGDLAAGQSRSFSATLRSSKTGEFTNTAKAEEPGGLSAQASAKTIVRKPELVVKKTGPQLRYLGRPAEYEITVQNTGDAPARDTVLVDTVSGGTFVKASHEGRSQGGKVIWNLGTLAPGASSKVTVTFTASQIGELRNQAAATAYCAQGEAAAVTQIRGVPAILLELIDVNDPIVTGGEEVYVITITNQGTAEDKNVQIVVTIPDEQQYVSSEGPTRGTVDGKKVTFAPIPSLAAKDKARYKVVTKATAPADVRFRVDLTSDMLSSPVVHTESTHIYD